MRLSILAAVTLLLTCRTVAALASHKARTARTETGIIADNGILSVRYDLKAAVFSAQKAGETFIRRGKFEDITDGETVTAKISSFDNTLGRGKAIELEFPSGRNYKLSLYDKKPFLCIGVEVHNKTNKTLIINELKTASLEIDLGKSPAELRTLGCDGLTAADENRASYTFLALANPKTDAGLVCGWLTQDKASGILTSRQDNNIVIVELKLEYGKLLIQPGQTAQAEIAAIGYFENTIAGLEEYADTIAEIYNIKLPGIPSGYCTWYSNPHGGASDEKHMAEMARFCRDNLTKFGFNTLQIDDNWQISGRDFTVHNPKGPYPNGMKTTADNIAAAGMTPGIWFIPFGWDHKRQIFADHQDWFVHRQDGSVYSVHWAGDCLDMTHPEARDFLDNAIRRMTRDWGYKYIKIDGLWTGMAVKILYPEPKYRPDGIGDAVFHNPEKTNIQAYRDGLKLVREAAGKDVYILGCNTAQNMRTLGASVALVDGMRIGSDTGARWGGILRGALMGSRLYFLHNRIWHNDPDCLMLRNPLTIAQAQTWGAWIAVTGQLNMVSEWLPALPPEKLDVLKRSIPNHGLYARPIDLFENDPAKIWRLTSEASGERIDIVGLFNWSEKEPASVTLDLKKFALPGAGKTQYVGFDYWADEFIPPFADVIETNLQPACCRVIALKPLLDRPVLVGTSRHITQGIIDITEQSWNEQSKTLAGKSKVVATDPYELRIFSPDENWKTDSVTLAKSDSEAGVKAESKQSECKIRITIESPENREVSWEIAFEKQQPQ
ncbi:MAG: alpha-galactosidase [Sedimentisphaerales bacterium]|nr:alpha-galactosidase [Sedimentisphaerales bacterium]